MQQIDPEESFRITVTPHKNCVVAQVGGQVDYHNADRFYERISHAWHQTLAQALVVEFSDLAFADSSALAVLARLQVHNRHPDHYLALTGVPAYLQRMMTITGLWAAFTVEPTLEAAIQAAERGAH